MSERVDLAFLIEKMQQVRPGSANAPEHPDGIAAPALTATEDVLPDAGIPRSDSASLPQEEGELPCGFEFDEAEPCTVPPEAPFNLSSDESPALFLDLSESAVNDSDASDDLQPVDLEFMQGRSSQFDNERAARLLEKLDSLDLEESRTAHDVAAQTPLDIAEVDLSSLASLVEEMQASATEGEAGTDKGPDEQEALAPAILAEKNSDDQGVGEADLEEIPMADADQPLSFLLDAVAAQSLPDQQESFLKSVSKSDPDKTQNEHTSGFQQFLKEKPAGELAGKSKTKQAKSEPKLLRKERRRGRRFKFSFASLFENSRDLGLDIGSGSIKYVHLAGSTRGVRLLGCGNIGLPSQDTAREPDESSTSVGRTLREKFSDKGYRNALITTAISGMEVVFKNIQIPKVARKELDKAVPWACRKDLPFPVESTTFQFIDLTDRKQGNHDKLDMFVVAAQQEVVDNHLVLLSAARLQPAKVSTVPYALWNLFRHAFKKKQHHGCHAIVDIGARSSHIVFINNGNLQFAREISTAGADVTEALMSPIFVEGREIRLTRKRAEELKRKYGIPDSSQRQSTEEALPLQDLGVLMVPVLERLVNDIQRTLEFFKEKFKVESVQNLHLTGGGALMPNLLDFMQRELQLNVRLLNPFENVAADKVKNRDELGRIGPRFSVAMGLALDHTRDLNLLPGTLRSSHILQYARRVFKYIFILLASAMVLLSQDARREFQRVSDEFEQLNTEYKKSEPMRQRFVASEKTYRNLQALAQQYSEALKINRGPAQHLKVISHFMPAKMALTSLRIQRRTDNASDDPDNKAMIERELLVLDGVAFEDNSLEGINLANFLLKLEAANYFKSVSLPRQTVVEDGNLQFTIECETFIEQP